MKKYVEDFKEWSDKPEVRKGIAIVRKGFRLIHDISKNIPTKEDEKWGATLKLVGLADTAINVIHDSSEDELSVFRRKKGLSSLTVDEGLVAFLSQVRDRVSARLEIVELGKRGYTLLTLNSSSKENAHRALFGRDSERSLVLFHTPGFDFRALTELVWDAFDNRIQVEITIYGHFEGVATFAPIHNPLFGEDLARMDKVLKQHRDSRVRKRTRSYMLYGPPGSGKSSFGQMFAEALGSRILRLSAASVSSHVVERLISLFKLLNPDVIMIDDIDKSMSTHAYLELLSTIKGGTSEALILTANSVSKFDKGLVRPGRIDTWLEFDVPSPSARRQILDGYLAANALLVSEEDRQAIVEATEGMTQDYVREAGELLVYTEQAEVLARIASMRKVLFPPESEDE